MVALRPGPLRGRGEPLDRALMALRGTRQHGSSSIVLVSGPAGIGKTALLAEISRRNESADSPMQKLWAGMGAPRP